MTDREPLDPGKYQFPTLMNDLEQGRVRLPPFQREFVWKPAKVVALLDSIYKGFPIGSLFYWKANREYVKLFRDIEGLDLAPPSMDQEIFFVLDGQQRLTSLWVTYKGRRVNGDDYGQICLNLHKAVLYGAASPEEMRDIQVFEEGEPDNSTLVALKDVLADKTRTYDEIRDRLDPSRKEAMSLCRDRFRTYPFSIVKVFDMEIEEAVEVFQRINQGGKRLSRFELVAANSWSEEFDLVKKVKDFNKRLDERTKFGKLDEITFVQSISLLAFGQCQTEHELSLKPPQTKEMWPRIEKALGDALDWVRDNYGVVRSEMLPYAPMLAVLAYYFAKHGVSAPSEHKSWLDRWFWRTAFSERYSKAQGSQMAEDVKLVERMLGGQIGEVSFPLKVTKDHISSMRMNQSASAIRKGIVCLMARRQPKHFVTATEVSLNKDHFSNLKDPNAHHIFPIKFLRRQLKRKLQEVHLLANFCFIPADLNGQIGSKPPSAYFAQFRSESADFDGALDSHMIPHHEGAGIWADDYDLFVKERTELLWAEVLSAVGEGDIYDSGAPVPLSAALLAVDALELAVRETVDSTLRQRIGPGYWKQCVPGDVQETTKKKIGERKSVAVPRVDDPMSKLQYCDIMDYHKILDHNWEVFETTFGSREDLRSHFLALKEYRNVLKHIRPMDMVVQKRGEAAVIWLRGRMRVPSPSPEPEGSTDGPPSAQSDREQDARENSPPTMIGEAEDSGVEAVKIAATLVHASSVSRGWMSRIRELCPNAAYSEKKYWAQFRSVPSGRTVAQLNPRGTEIRISLALPPGFDQRLGPPLSTSHYANRYPSRFVVRSDADVGAAAELIEKALAHDLKR